MPKLTLMDPQQGAVELEYSVGASVMQTAVQNGPTSIVAECGGALSCATCHVYLDAADIDRFPAPEAGELAMLEFTAAESRPTSRLSCQLALSQEHDGLTVTIPDTQY